jgi:excinuclease ABC subunit A
MVPDDALTIRERAVAAWPQAWGGQNQRDILTTLGHDVTGRGASCRERTATGSSSPTEQPTVPVYSGLHAGRGRRALKRGGAAGYMGTFTSARRTCCTPSPHAERDDEAARAGTW